MGHIARCVILANHLVKYYNVFFIIDKNKKKFFKIKKNGYKVSKKYTYLSRAKYILRIIYQ